MNKIMYKCYGVFDRNKCTIIIIIIIIKIIIPRKTKPVPTAKSEQLIKIIKISTKTIPVPTVGRNS